MYCSTLVDPLKHKVLHFIFNICDLVEPRPVEFWQPFISTVYIYIYIYIRHTIDIIPPLYSEPFILIFHRPSINISGCIECIHFYGEHVCTQMHYACTTILLTTVMILISIN